MSKKKEPQPRKESSSLLGWMAAFAVIAAIVVFAFTRSPNQPAETQAPVATTTPTPAEPAPQPSPVQAPESAASHEDHSGHDHGTPVASQGTETGKRLPPYFENPDAAEPLAPTRDPASVAPHARDAYQVALQKPKLMAQLPCFCYCDRFGHKSLHDCFVSNHAEECDICMKEAIEADRMDAQGMSPQEIRSVVISTYYQRS